MVGYIKLFRQLRDHDLWKEKPFSPGQAWIEMLFLANFRESKIPHPSKIGSEKVQPGEFICSQRDFCRTLGWSRNKLRRFWKWLENDTMIETTFETNYTRVKILNWSKFQSQVGKDDTTNDTTNDTRGDTTHDTRGDTRLDPHQKKSLRRNKEGEEARAKTPAPALASQRGKTPPLPPPFGGEPDRATPHRNGHKPNRSPIAERRNPDRIEIQKLREQCPPEEISRWRVEALEKAKSAAEFMAAPAPAGRMLDVFVDCEINKRVAEKFGVKI